MQGLVPFSTRDAGLEEFCVINFAVAAWLVMAAVAACPASVHESWPQFRGPTGQGLYAGKCLPLEWSPSRNIRWKQPIPGKGWSSPILYDNRLYLTTAIPNGEGKEGYQSLRALCLDAESGKIFWEKEVMRQESARAPNIHPKNSHASPTPVTDGKRLFVHFGHQGVACLTLDGAILWLNRDLTYQPVHGNGGSPVLAGGKLVFSCDGGDKQFVVALDAATGKVIWKTARTTSSMQKFSFHTPLVIEVEKKLQVVSSGSGVVNGYDLETGKEIWRVRHGGYSVVPCPVYGHGLVFMSTGYNTPDLLAIRPDGHGDVTDTHIAWKVKRGAPLSASPLLVGDELYFIADSGTASCLDAKTGKSYWQERLGGNYSASPIYGAGKIYFLAEDGQTAVIEANKQFKLLGKNKLEERALASPAAADGVLYLRTEKHLWSVQANETTLPGQ
jgi:outer membrane protein assembly factor BamB